MYRFYFRENAHRDIDLIFRNILPGHGMAAREAQIDLSHRMLDALFQNKIALCDAGVGIGKTYAYLAACAIFKKYQTNFTGWSLHQQRPIVLSTSSIALQSALIGEYIPMLSDAMLGKGVIDKPLRAVVRKGKEHFVCDYRLEFRLNTIGNKIKNDGQRRALLNLKRYYDMDVVHGLSGYDRRHVCVPQKCPRECPSRDYCRYQKYMQMAIGSDVFIQICNHNYLLADATHRLNDYKPLLIDYEALIIDEAHKLPEAAQQMFEKRLTQENMSELCLMLGNEQFTYLSRMLKAAFQVLLESVYQPRFAPHEKRAFISNSVRKLALKQTVRCLERILVTVTGEIPYGKIHRLEEVKEVLQTYLHPAGDVLLYLEYELSGYPVLCVGRRNYAHTLKHQLWDPGIPAILTSGTLMAGNGFERTRQVTGLADSQRVTECVSESPFCYQQNCLLYFPKAKKKFSMGSRVEIKILAAQINQLIGATYGHTLVLFTSYSLMGNIYRELKERIQYPLLKVWKNSSNVISEFKKQSNSVLFAAGTCWEGVDFPGDLVSSLIIVRLPFAVPDPISEAEQARYDSLDDYIREIVVPDMQKKLRQGFGRAIRTETDTCVVSILDRRAAKGGRYHEDVLKALPTCMMTEQMVDVEAFIWERKGADYYT